MGGALGGEHEAPREPQAHAALNELIEASLTPLEPILTQESRPRGGHTRSQETPGPYPHPLGPRP